MNTRMNKWLSRSLSAKLIFTLLFILTLTILTISSLYYWSSANIIASNVRESAKQSAKQSADYVSLMLTVGSDMGQQIFRDARIQQVIREEARGNLTVDQKFDHKNTVGDILNNVMYTSSFVRSIYLLKDEGNSWGSGLFNTSKVARFTLKEHEWYNSVTGGRVDDMWLPIQYDPFSGGGENTELVLTFVRPFRNLETRESIGVIVVNLDGERMLEAIQRIRLGVTGRFAVVDGGGNVMIGAELEGELAVSAGDIAQMAESLRAHGGEEIELETAVNGVSTYVVASKMPNDWMIVGSVPVEEVVGDIQRMQRNIWMYASVLLALATLAGWQFSRRITSPLKRLMEQMREIQKSNFHVLSEVKSQDEIGQLSRRFNQMVRQIEALLDEVNKVEGKKREAELRALRHQINPHFLYNTLASIRWMVKFGNNDGAYESVSALVKLMEAGMGKQGPFCSLGDEFELLKTYMVIQRARYGGHIRLSIECDAALLGVRLPRMLLQPIVENAIFHGLAPRPEGGDVRVTVRTDEAEPSGLVIAIADNGLGMEQERLAELIRWEQTGGSGIFGIGLKHVHETIQLYYGEQSGVHIESRPGEGTVVLLRLQTEAREGHAV